MVRIKRRLRRMVRSSHSAFPNLQQTQRQKITLCLSFRAVLASSRAMQSRPGQSLLLPLLKRRIGAPLIRNPTRLSQSQSTALPNQSGRNHRIGIPTASSHLRLQNIASTPADALARHLAAARALAVSETRGSFTDEVMILQKLNSYGWLVSTDHDDVFNICIARGRRKTVPL